MNPLQRNALLAFIASIDAAKGVGSDCAVLAHVAGPTRGRSVVRLPPGLRDALLAALEAPRTAVETPAATPMAPSASEPATGRVGPKTGRFANLEMD